jgi:hypothetical protein
MRDHAMVSMCDERGHVIQRFQDARRHGGEHRRNKLVLCQLENMMSSPNASLRLSYFHPHLHIMLELRAAHVQLPGKP